MNKRKIKQELRRSAREDDFPWSGLGIDAFDQMRNWRIVDRGEFFSKLWNDDIRTFYLLVAEAL